MIIGCAKRAESLTGAKVRIESEPIYAERYPCLPICEDFKENMARVGISMCLPDPKLLFGSSDIGNVSIKIPAIHDYLSITDEEIPAHSKEYAKAAAEPTADEICIKGAQGLAMTGLDLLLDESLYANQEMLQLTGCTDLDDFIILRNINSDNLVHS